MDKSLHIRILEVLQQSNAVDAMVDIKPNFVDELDTQEKRKHFKGQIDFLLGQGLIETNGRFDYLTWELLNGLYPIDNKKMEARLVGNWQIYFSQRGVKGALPPEAYVAPPPPPAKKISMYDAPAAVVPYPGVPVKESAQPTAPVPPPTAATDAVKTTPPIPAASKTDSAEDSDFELFKTKKQPLPPPPPPVVEPPKPQTPGLVEFSSSKTTYIPPKDAGTIESLNEPYVPFKSTYISSPKAEPFTPPVIVPPAPAPVVPPLAPIVAPAPIVEPIPQPVAQPIPPPAPVVLPPLQPEPLQQPVTAYKPPVAEPPAESVFSNRISARSSLNKEEEEDAPIITARAARLQAQAATQPPPEPPPAPEPPKPQPPATPPAQQVVNLRSAQYTSAAEMPAGPVSLGTAKPTAAAAPSLAPYAPPPRPVKGNYSSIQFDTENNPFAGLGVIGLSDKDAPKKLSIVTILKWALFVIVLLVIIAAVVIYKRKYT